LTGGVDDLASLIENASISERVVARSLDILEEGIHSAAVRLRGATLDRPEVNASVAEALHQEDGEQTSRMAMAIIANALTFHTMLAGVHGVRTLDALRRRGALPKKPVLQEWERILEINYWSIFHVAREVLIPIPDGIAARLLDRLADVASELEAHGTTRSHDIYGRTFQQLIADRKFLATFYTLPESAALLAELAVGLIDADWSERAALTGLRACDFACGTGTLITAAYHALLARHRRAGGNDAAIHREMMERSIVAADIMPAATHLTISMLSSAQPTTPFEQTQVHLLPYGRQTDADAGFALGALDLIRKQHGTGLFENTGIQVHRGTGDTAGVVREGAIMNPPFTRPTNHEVATVPVPSFAGLGNDDEERSPCRIPPSSTGSCSGPPPRRCARSPPTRNIWAPRSASSRCCTRGTRPLACTRTCIAWFPAAASPTMGCAGSRAGRDSSCRCACSPVYSAASFSGTSKKPSTPGGSASAGR